VFSQNIDYSSDEELELTMRCQWGARFDKVVQKTGTTDDPIHGIAKMPMLRCRSGLAGENEKTRCSNLVLRATYFAGDDVRPRRGGKDTRSENEKKNSSLNDHDNKRFRTPVDPTRSSADFDDSFRRSATAGRGSRSPSHMMANAIASE